MLSLHVLVASALIADPEQPFTPAPAEEIVVCETGGWRATDCSVVCHRAFNFWTTQCNVSCRSGYMACCSCESGCQCLIDHEEMSPLPPEPPPDPDPDPELPN